MAPRQRAVLCGFVLSFTFLLAAAGCSRKAVEAGAVSSAPIPTPSWLKTEPLIIVGNWDSMPIFRRRVGGNPVWQEDEYRRELSEDTVAKLKDLGVTMAVIHFYKGFGLEAEREHLDDARKLAGLLHKHGIRVGVYVGSTVAYETFLLEKPEAESWFAPDYLGRPVFYSEQTFRKRVYFMHPGYREYMKRVLRVAVEDFKADEIDFDNTSMQAQPPIFLHPLAIEDFREWLKNRYPAETLKKRFGFADVRYVLPPRYDRPLRAINDPLFQEWADFRCHQLNAYYGELARHIRGMNSNVAIATNPHSGISGRNTVWDQGVDYPGLVPNMDIVWTEEGNEAGISPEGVLVSKIRTYKMATSLGSRVLTYTAGTRGGKLQMAESMAYNRQSLGMVGGVLSALELPHDQRRYVRFFREQFPRYRDVENVADVAVLHSHASMAFNNDLPWQSAMLVEQALIQARVPFDIVFDAALENLSRYRALVLPDQEALSDTQLGLIRKYVNGGGGLVATELASLYTEWRQRRRSFGLEDLFGISAPAWRGARAGERSPDVQPVRKQAGRGRVAYLPEVRAAAAKPPSAPMTSQLWKLPLNAEEIVAAVKWAAGALSLEVKAPPTVTAEILRQTTTGDLQVHLLNYDAERRPVLMNLEVSVEMPAGKTAASVTLLSPDEEAPRTLKPIMNGNRAVFTVPRLATYSVAVLKAG